MFVYIFSTKHNALLTKQVELLASIVQKTRYEFWVFYHPFQNFQHLLQRLRVDADGAAEPAHQLGSALIAHFAVVERLVLRLAMSGTQQPLSAWIAHHARRVEQRYARVRGGFDSWRDWRRLALHVGR